MTFQLFLNGGAVRDNCLGLALDQISDLDYTVVYTGSEHHPDVVYDAMNLWLAEQDFEIFLCQPEFVTTRARFPQGHQMSHKTADFVLARREGPYSDGRRPDWVKIGTLLDDQRRRDFTINSMVMHEAGAIIDPFGGQIDLAKNLLRCVGTAKERFTEDALRALRAIRFRITKGFEWDQEIREALNSSWLPPLFTQGTRKPVPLNRRRGEMLKCFKFDTLKTMEVLSHEISSELLFEIFRDGLWLKPTNEAT